MIAEQTHRVRLITDRARPANGFDPQKTTPGKVMTPKIIYCFEDQDIAAAGAIMQENKIRRLPVINRERRLVGMVSLAAIALGGNDGNPVCAPKPLPAQKLE